MKMDFGKIKESKGIRILVLILLLVGLVYYTSTLELDKISFTLKQEEIFYLAAIFIIFNITRMFSMKIFLELFNIKLTLKETIELHFLSAFGEIASFIGKVGADATKYLYLTGKEKKKAVIGFRLLSTYAYLLVFFGFFYIVTMNIALLALFIAITIAPIILQKKINAMLPEKNYSKLVQANLLFMASVILTIIGAAIIIATFSHTINLDLLFSYFFSYIAGILSTLPFGFGVQEALIIGTFSSTFTNETITTIIILTRITTVIPSALIGAMIFMKKLLVKKQQQLKK